MNGIDKIKEKIINDAIFESQNLIETAQKDAQIILNKYKLESDARKNKILSQAQDRKKDIIKYKYDMAELEGRKQILSTKQTILDEIFKEAFVKLKTLNAQDYVAFLSKLAADSSLGGNEAVIFSETDKETTGKEIVKTANQILVARGKAGNLAMSDETREIDGGLILKDGDIETNCTFDILYNFKRNELTTEVANILF